MYLKCYEFKSSWPSDLGRKDEKRSEVVRKEKWGITNACTCLVAFAEAGIMGAAQREMLEEKTEKCI